MAYSYSLCPICGESFKECPHSIADMDKRLHDDDIEAAIDKRLLELGVVEKSHPGIMQAAKLRKRRSGRVGR